MSNDKKNIFISYAFSNEKKLGEDTVDKQFLQTYIGAITDILKSKGLNVWHSLIVEEDNHISGLPYQEAIDYCKEKMYALNQENKLMLLSILKYPGTCTTRDNIPAKSSSGMIQELTEAKKLQLPQVVAIQSGLENADHVAHYFTDEIAHYIPPIIFNDLEDLYSQIQKHI